MIDTLIASSPFVHTNQPTSLYLLRPKALTTHARIQRNHTSHECFQETNADTTWAWMHWKMHMITQTRTLDEKSQPTIPTTLTRSDLGASRSEEERMRREEDDDETQYFNGDQLMTVKCDATHNIHTSRKEYIDLILQIISVHVKHPGHSDQQVQKKRWTFDAGTAWNVDDYHQAHAPNAATASSIDVATTSVPMGYGGKDMGI